MKTGMNKQHPVVGVFGETPAATVLWPKTGNCYSKGFGYVNVYVNIFNLKAYVKAVPCSRIVRNI